ncbi:ATP-binding protein [Mesorhizobium sp. B2-4-17]|uniref:ATP-binding protein n=1 Tax=Mesorhizobium sp. B2-4-17 TaxID=2589932 RepID=UPI001FEEB596|nr:ATP-binding protein [Mesorhizobium sp. B2-4-17]
MVPEAFVRGIRDLGYRSNGDALAELIDNSLQAYADRIDVLFGYESSTSNKKPLQLAILDNGHGMEPDMIRMAVMWGGTHRENDRGGLGRYGYGLPCSSVSLGRRFTVMSQVSGGGLHAVRLDLDDITAGKYTDRAGDIIVPAPQPTDLPPFVSNHIASTFPDGWASGTIILIEKLDRLEWTTTQGLRDNLCRHFGVAYHKLCGEAALYVDGQFVKPIDPLFLTPEFHLHDLDDDRAHPFDPVHVEVRDPDTGRYLGAMTLRYAWMPPSFGSVDKDRDAVGLNANARFSILKDYHGIIFSRNGRLIDVQTRTPWTTFINNDRYIKVEIEFSATLDEAFGVTTSKQQTTVSTLIWDLLREAGLPKAIEQLRNKVKEAKALRRMKGLAPEPGQRRLSERASDMVNVEHSNPQRNTALLASLYRVEFEYKPEQSFFRIGRGQGARILHLNTAHRFIEEMYESAVSTAEMRTALEILLFSLGDVMLDGAEEAQACNALQLLSWSRRLDRALQTLSEHLGSSDEQDIGQPAWPNGRA